MKLEEIPKKPYINFDQYLRKHRACILDVPRGVVIKCIKCIDCMGSGKIYDPNDPPDCIEGYKLVSTIRCPRCLGSGKGNIKDWRVEYKREIDIWKAHKAKSAKRRATQQAALKKLTKAQREALGWS